MGEELYELPKGWIWTTIKFISNNYDGMRIPLKKAERDEIEGIYPYYGASGIIDYVKKFIFDGNFLLIAEDGANLVTRSKPIAFIAKGQFWVNNHAHIVKTLGNIPLSYLEHYFNATDLSLFITGTAQPKLTQNALYKIKIPLPPLAEQYRIVAKIEELFTELDAGVELLKKLKAKLKRYRQAVLKAAVEGNLTKEWREANQGKLEPASMLRDRILKQRREKWEAEQLAKMNAQGKTPKDDSWKLKYKEPVAPDTSDLPELPDGWCWVTLISLCTAIGDVDHKMPKAQEQGIPYISTRDFLPNGNINFKYAKKISTEDFEKLCRKIYPTFGDILLSRYGTVGEVRLIDNNLKFQASYSIAIIKPVFYEVNKFIAMCLQSDTVQNQIKKYIRGVAQPDLGLAHIKELILPFPSSLEQNEIISEMNRHISVIDQLEKTIDSNLKRAEKLRQSILKQAFEGKLVPQDPNDEPAEKLLERIKAEKAQQTTTKTKRKTQPKTQSNKQLELPLE